MTRIKNKPLLLAAGALTLAAVAWLAFGFFGIQSAFIDNEVSEAGPVFAATQPEANSSIDEQASEDAIAFAEDSEAAPIETGTDADTSSGTTPAEPGAEADAAPALAEIVTLYSGEFSGTSRYNISGEALVLNDGSDQRFLRFENFESSNGPDLKVYLRADNGDFVSLGDLKGNVGEQNYEIPVDVDLDVFSTVDIWCERFSVGFGGAPLTPTP